MREVRAAAPADREAIADIFWRGVSEGAAPRYDAAQRAAWLPERPDAAAFAARLAGQRVWVSAGRAPTGFATLRADGYLDFLYVLPEHRGDGTADALLAVAVNAALAAGLGRLTTRASDMARPFFARHGWHAVAPAPQTRGGVTVPATDMALTLSARAHAAE